MCVSVSVCGTGGDDRPTSEEIATLVARSGVDPSAGLGMGELAAVFLAPRCALWKCLLQRIAELSHLFGMLCEVSIGPT